MCDKISDFSGWLTIFNDVFKPSLVFSLHKFSQPKFSDWFRLNFEA